MKSPRFCQKVAACILASGFARLRGGTAGGVGQGNVFISRQLPDLRGGISSGWAGGRRNNQKAPKVSGRRRPRGGGGQQAAGVGKGWRGRSAVRGRKAAGPSSRGSSAPTAELRGIGCAQKAAVLAQGPGDARLRFLRVRGTEPSWSGHLPPPAGAV